MKYNRIDIKCTSRSQSFITTQGHWSVHCFSILVISIFYTLWCGVAIVYYFTCLEYFIFFSIDSSEARIQYHELLSFNHVNNNLCTWQNAFSRHRMDSSLWFKRMELIEDKSLIWEQKGKLYIIYEKVMWILWILRFKSIHLLFYTFIHIIHMYISNDSNVILKYFHFVLPIVTNRPYNI